MENAVVIRSGSRQDFRCAAIERTMRKSWRHPLRFAALLAFVACANRSNAQEGTPSWETIAATMQSAQTLLAAGDAGNSTQRRQRDVIEHLDALIAAAEANSAKSDGQSSDSPGENMPPADPNSSASTDGQNANPNALESVERHGKTDVQAPDKAVPRRTSAEEFWGQLPKHVEERIRALQSADTRAVPKYRAAVEAYFQRLLEKERSSEPSMRD
jgi:hypothetical protein